MATVVCDFFLQNCAANKKVYSARKVDFVVDADSGQHPADEAMSPGAFEALNDVTRAAVDSDRKV